MGGLAMFSNQTDKLKAPELGWQEAHGRPMSSIEAHNGPECGGPRAANPARPSVPATVTKGVRRSTCPEEGEKE